MGRTREWNPAAVYPVCCGEAAAATKATMFRVIHAYLSEPLVDSLLPPPLEFLGA